MKMPKHVAIIMDGNRRWAAARGLEPISGHLSGAETLVDIVEEAITIGVDVLTVYSFSTENWARPAEEIDDLMSLFRIYLKKMHHIMLKKNIRFETIGDLTSFPDDLKYIIFETKRATSSGNKITLILALNYGGRDDLKRAFVKMIDDIQSNKLCKSDISEQVISKYLDTHEFADPDLLIRSGGDSRVSNFLIWQIAYSEMYISDVLWPDFTKKNFNDAILEYQRRERRLGG